MQKVKQLTKKKKQMMVVDKAAHANPKEMLLENIAVSCRLIVRQIWHLLDNLVYKNKVRTQSHKLKIPCCHSPKQL